MGDVLDHVLAKLHGRQVLHEVKVHSELSLEEGSAVALDEGSTESAVSFVLSIERSLVIQQDVLDEVLHLLVVGAITAALCHEVVLHEVVVVAAAGRLGVLGLVALQHPLNEASWPVQWPLLLVELAGLRQRGL